MKYFRRDNEVEWSGTQRCAIFALAVSLKYPNNCRQKQNILVTEEESP